MEFQIERNSLSAKFAVKAFYKDGKRGIKTQENSTNMNVMTFTSQQCDTTHFNVP
jgi:hypothetical protein